MPHVDDKHFYDKQTNKQKIKWDKRKTKMK